MLKLLRFKTNGHLSDLPDAIHSSIVSGVPGIPGPTTLEALIESEERFRLAADAAGIGTWDWDIASGGVHLSERTYALHGLGDIGFSGTYDAYLKLIHPNDREDFANGIVRAIQDTTDLDVEYRIMLPAGGIRWVEARGSVRFDAAGNAVRMLGMGIDITKRKRTEAALRFLADSAELLGASLDYETVLQRVAELAVPALADWCAVDLVDPDGTIRRLAVTHADPAKSEIAQKFKEYVPDRRKSEPLIHVLRSARSILEPDLPDSTLVAAALDDNHLRMMRELQFRSVMIVPLLTLERTLGALTLMSGESGRRYDDADLAIAEDLAKRASLAINNAALYRESRESAEKLRRANAAKDEFLGLVSHELKTPITTILGNAELLEKRAGLLDEESQSEALADVRTDAERLNRVIDNLLVLARIEGGEEIEAEPLSLLPLSKRICDEHARRHEGRDIVLRADTDMALVSAHQDHVELVLRNLLNNAEKYSCRTMPIELDLAAGSDHVFVSVLDRGVGIPDDEIEAVFTAFYRSSRTPADQQGFGIGLAVCKRLVEAQGGEIWARRREGGGCEFGFSLPAYDEAA